MTRFLLLWGTALLILGCGNLDGGSFTLSFGWDIPPPETVYIWVQVEERTDPTQPGKILASAGPEALVPGQPLGLALDEVPNGDRRYVVAEVRESSNPALPVLYYGISDAFSLAAGKDTVVEVPMAFQVPEIDSNADVGLLFDGVELTTVSEPMLSSATVVLEAAQATGVILANDAAFSSAPTEFSFGEESALDCQVEEREGIEWHVCQLEAWDLTAELDAPPKDQRYTVFAKFIDRYGYESGVYRASVLLDQEAPLVLLASLTPEVVRPGDTTYLNVTFHEPVDESDTTLQPDLTDTSQVAIDGPTRVGDSTAYVWQITPSPNYAGPESFGLMLATADALENSSETASLMASADSPLQVRVDAIAPQLVHELSELPEQTVFGFANDGDTLTARFVVEETWPPAIIDDGGECQGCPNIRLGSRQLGAVVRDSKLDSADGTRLGFRWDYSLAKADFDKTDTTVPLSLSWADQAGNPLEDQVVDSLRFDFIRPSVLNCSLSPLFGISTSTFVYRLTADESLTETPELLVDSAVGVLFEAPPEVFDNGQTYQWSQSAADLSDGAFTVAAKFVDAAGNAADDDGQGTVCTFQGTVDGVEPVLVGEAKLSTHPEVLDGTGAPALVVGDGLKLVANFSVAEASGLDDGFPEVRLLIPNHDVLLSPTVAKESEPGVWDYSFLTTISAQELQGGEGLWPVQVILKDPAGNVTLVPQLTGQLVKVDFTPPQAICSTVPDPGSAGYAVDAVVAVKVSALEPLSVDSPPTLTQSFAPAAPGEVFTVVEGSNVLFEGTIGHWQSEGTFDLAVGLTDLVGNSTPPGGDACEGSLTGIPYDALYPMVSDLTVHADGEPAQPTTGLGQGIVVSTSFVIDNSPLEPTVTLGGSAMSPEPKEPAQLGNDQVLWTFVRPLNGTEPEGIQPIGIAVSDPAGNAITALQDPGVANLDFSAPIADCFVNVSPAIAGDSQRITVSLSEPVQGLPKVTSKIPWGYRADLSDPGDDSPTYVYEHEIAIGAAPTEWIAAIAAQDTAGNPATGEPLCQVAGSYDGTFVTIDDGGITVAYPNPDAPGAWLDGSGRARIGSRVTIEFTTSEVPAAESTEVRVGGKLAEFQALEVTSHIYSFLVEEADGFVDGQQLSVTVEVADSAGNVTSETLGSVTFDTTPPTVFNTANFERCDGFAAAKVGFNQLWVRKDSQAQPYGCTYSFLPIACNQEGDAGGGRVRATFALNEPVQVDRVSVSVAGKPLAIDPCESNSTLISALYEPTGTESQSGWLPVVATMEDLAGNQTTETIGQLRFDYSAPQAPKVADANKVIYQRTPWGSEATNYTSRYEVWGEPGAVEAGAVVKALDSATVDGAYQLGTAQADNSGAFGATSQAGQLFTLDAADRAHVYLVAQDTAGNLSDADNNPNNGLQAALVRNTRYVATFGDKDAGSTLVNPNRFATTTWMRQSLHHPDDVELGEAAGIATVGGSPLTTKGASLAWRKVVPNDGEPLERSGPGLATDVGRGRIVLFGGGGNANAVYSDTWEWDGRKWHFRAPVDPESDGNPAGRRWPAMSYDSRRGRTVLFGGERLTELGYTVTSDVWEWDGTSWQAMTPTDPEGDGNPAARWKAASAYDSLRRETLVFGGEWPMFGGGNTYTDTWAWNGKSWRKIVPDDPEGDGNPGAGGNLAMAFDAVRGVAVLVQQNGQTWEWNGASWKLADSSLNPQYQASLTLTYSEALGKSVLFTCCNVPSGTTWLWNGTAWSKVNLSWPSGVPALAKWSFGKLTYDAESRLPLLFGELEWSGDSAPSSGTAHLTGSYWALLSGGNENNAQGRSMHDLFYYPPQHQVTTTGGMNGQSYLAETRLLWGTSWEKVSSSSPTGLRNAASCYYYNGTTKRIFSFGGISSSGNLVDTLRFWEGSGWKSPLVYSGGDGIPEPRYKAGFTYDTQNDVGLLFGGSDIPSSLGDTWLLDRFSFLGGWYYDWTKLSPQGAPSKRCGHVLEYNSSSKSAILFGGSLWEDGADGYADTWEWKNSNWLKLTPVDPEGDGNPMGRSLASGAYVGKRKRVVVFGGIGSDTGSQLDDAWEWTGSSWQHLTTSDPSVDGNPAPRQESGLAYDTLRDELVLMGGSDAGGADLADTWKGRFSDDTMPGHLASFPVDSAGYCGDPDFTRVEVSWRAGGSSPATDKTKTGALLRVWDEGRWRAIDDHAATNPSELAWTTTDANEIHRLLFGDYRTLNFNAVSRGTNHEGHAEVSTDYVEVTVDFRLPANDENLCD